MLLPKKSIEISLSKIKQVETTNWFLGRSNTSRFLKVDFINENGDFDSCAWQVHDTYGWIEAINQKRVG